MSRQSRVRLVKSANGASEAESLTRLEQLAVRGLIARDQQIHRELVVPLQEDWQDVVKAIAERVGLDPEQCQINVDTMTVDRLPMPEAVADPEPIPEPSS